jgi:hypothetical protein
MRGTLIRVQRKALAPASSCNPFSWYDVSHFSILLSPHLWGIRATESFTIRLSLPNALALTCGAAKVRRRRTPCLQAGAQPPGPQAEAAPARPGIGRGTGGDGKRPPLGRECLPARPSRRASRPRAAGKATLAALFRSRPTDPGNYGSVNFSTVPLVKDHTESLGTCTQPDTLDKAGHRLSVWGLYTPPNPTGDDRA